MLAAEHFRYRNASMPNRQLLEVHHSKISLHHAKEGYDYPAIRLPFTFSGLIGLSTRIYQTVHDGALAFLIVVSSSNKNEESQKKSENFTASSRYSYLHGRDQAFESLRAHRFFFQSEAGIKPGAEYDEDTKLQNSFAKKVYAAEQFQRVL